VGADRQSDGTRALLKMTFYSLLVPGGELAPGGALDDRSAANAGPDHQAGTIKVFATKCKKISQN
jgi:hypothetical protein